MQIQFLGAADTVTGSRHLVTLGGQRILLDCGLFQGYKVLRERNWQPLGALPRDIDAVVLSHAHLDHSGWLPGLVKAGFKGPIYASPATRDLAEVLLLDSAHLQEEDARRANRYGYSRHEKALPLYTKADAKRAIARIQAVPPGRALKVGDVAVQMTPVGHLLGACSVRLAHRNESLAFSGDVGRSHDLLMPPPQPLPAADVLLVESTYGNRLHPAGATEAAPAELARIIRETVNRGGKVLLPSFAVGRAQALLLVLQRLKAAGEIPAQLPIYLDSPMAIEATALYTRHRRLLRVPQREIAGLTEGVRMVVTAVQSQRLAASRFPAVVISASGMATGGRVLHHLTRFVGDPRSTVLLAGFQAAGTRGDRLARGESEIKIHGQLWPVRARIERMDNLSAHADYEEMLDWMSHISNRPRKVFVTHGETEAAQSMRQKIEERFGWNAVVPHYQQTEEM